MVTLTGSLDAPTVLAVQKYIETVLGSMALPTHMLGPGGIVGNHDLYASGGSVSPPKNLSRVGEDPYTCTWGGRSTGKSRLTAVGPVTVTVTMPTMTIVDDPILPRLHSKTRKKAASAIQRTMEDHLWDQLFVYPVEGDIFIPRAVYDANGVMTNQREISAAQRAIKKREKEVLVAKLARQDFYMKKSAGEY